MCWAAAVWQRVRHVIDRGCGDRVSLVAKKLQSWHQQLRRLQLAALFHGATDVSVVARDGPFDVCRVRAAAVRAGGTPAQASRGSAAGGQRTRLAGRSAVFRRLWGSKAELRRFKDGSVEACSGSAASRSGTPSSAGSCATCCSCTSQASLPPSSILQAGPTTQIPPPPPPPPPGMPSPPDTWTNTFGVRALRPEILRRHGRLGLRRHRDGTEVIKLSQALQLQDISPTSSDT